MYNSHLGCSPEALSLLVISGFMNTDFLNGTGVHLQHGGLLLLVLIFSTTGFIV